VNYTFKTFTEDRSSTPWVPPGEPLQKFTVTEDAMPGFVVRYFEEHNGDPPLTGMQKLLGQCWFGATRPDLILSSEKMMKRMVRLLIYDQRKPVMYGCNFGFYFNGAVWSYPDGTGVDIADGWVFVLNREHPLSPRLNGCMKAAWMDSK
jgi:hypothetical protein